VLQALTELAVGVVTYRLYSREHPRATVARQRLCEQVTRLSSMPGADDRELTLVLLENELFVGDRPFTRTGEQVGGLVRHLRRHALEHVTFLPGLEDHEVDRFLEFLAGSAGVAPPATQHIRIGALVLDSGLEHGGEHPDAPRPGTAVRDRLQVVRDAFDAFAAGERLPVASLGEVVGRTDRQLERIEDPLTLLATLERDLDWPVVHAHNVAVLAMSLAVPLGVGEAERRELGLAGLLHDIGSAGASATQIAAGLALDGDVWELDEDHPRRGLELLIPIPELPPLVPVVVFEHHLKFQGGGYPTLPELRPPHLAARVVAVAEVFDILHTVRGPRGACTREGVSAALQAAAGDALDPFLVHAMEVIWELAEMGSGSEE
jgi:HD-GYP domain-containing protein (c-di-GMP phosphodiesterase class II)